MIRDPTFNPTDFRDFDLRKISDLLGRSENKESGWKTYNLQLDVPVGFLKMPNVMNVSQAVPFKYRSICERIKSVFSSKLAKNFCYEPFRVRFKPSETSPSIEVYGQLYTSKTFMDYHDEIQSYPRKDNLPRAVATTQIWSDGMAATNFGSGYLWLVYIQFGNQCKYERHKPSRDDIHTIAHVPPVRCIIHTLSTSTDCFIVTRGLSRFH